MSDAELAARLDAAAFLAGAEVYLDRFERAIDHSSRALVIARATGQGELLPILIPSLSTALGARGRLAEAAELLDAAIEGTRVAGNRQGLAWNLLNRCYMASRTGDVDLAATAGDESIELTRGLDASLVFTYAGVCRAMGFSQPATRPEPPPCSSRRGAETTSASSRAGGGPSISTC